MNSHQLGYCSLFRTFQISNILSNSLKSLHIKHPSLSTSLYLENLSISAILYFKHLSFSVTLYFEHRFDLDFFFLNLKNLSISSQNPLLRHLCRPFLPFLEIYPQKIKSLHPSQVWDGERLSIFPIKTNVRYILFTG